MDMERAILTALVMLVICLVSYHVGYMKAIYDIHNCYPEQFEEMAKIAGRKKHADTP